MPVANQRWVCCVWVCVLTKCVFVCASVCLVLCVQSSTHTQKVIAEILSLTCSLSPPPLPPRCCLGVLCRGPMWRCTCPRCTTGACRRASGRFTRSVCCWMSRCWSRSTTSRYTPPAENACHYLGTNTGFLKVTVHQVPTCFFTPYLLLSEITQRSHILQNSCYQCFLPKIRVSILAVNSPEKVHPLLLPLALLFIKCMLKHKLLKISPVWGHEGELIPLRG